MSYVRYAERGSYLGKGVPLHYGNYNIQRILTRPEIVALCRQRGRESGCNSAVSTIVEHNVGLVLSIANKYKGPIRRTLPELVSDGIWGLYKAAQLFNPKRGTQFSTYATPIIIQAIYSPEMDNRVVGIPPGTEQGYSIILKSLASHRAEHGREPTLDEICKKSGCNMLVAKRALSIPCNRISLNQIPKRLKTIDSTIDDIRDNKNIVYAVEFALGLLTENERDLIKMRYGLEPYNNPMTMKQIGAVLSITSQAVSKRVKTIIEKLELKKSRIQKALEGDLEGSKTQKRF